MLKFKRNTLKKGFVICKSLKDIYLYTLLINQKHHEKNVTPYFIVLFFWANSCPKRLAMAAKRRHKNFRIKKEQNQ